MDDLVVKLVELIREEEAVLNKFLDCLNRQKEHIIQNNLQEFELATAEEEALVTAIKQLEEGRMHVVKTIAMHTGARADDLTLTRLIELNLGENSEELRNLKKNLASLVNQVKRALRVNQYLIKRSLNYIQRSIEWFIDDGSPNVVYSPKGQRSMGDVGNLIVDKSY